MKKKFERLQNLLAAAAFAEEGDLDSARELLGGGKKVEGMFSVCPPAGSTSRIGRLRRKAAAFTRMHEKIAGAVTYAEAGEHGFARELEAEAFRKKRQILVVGESDGFTEPLVNYTAGLAKRLSCDVIALSVITTPGMGVNEEFIAHRHARIIESANVFKNKLTLFNIGFQHLIKSGDLHKAIRVTYQEAARIAYVLLPAESMAQDRGLLHNIPVFCVSPLPSA